MTSEDISKLATAWINAFVAPVGSSEREELEDVILYDFLEEDPESVWLLILEIHRKDQSIAIQQVLSAGPIEDLPGRYGGFFIGRVEEEARSDPSFAKVLGGVWQNSMSDHVWERLRKVWDRTGWDGIPDA